MTKLRVAYAGYDFFSSCLAALLERSDTSLVLCLTGKPGETISNILRLANSSSTPVIFGRPTAQTIQTINEAQVDLLVCAAYSYRVPIESLSIHHAINVHPSLLPNGRGPNPLPYLVDGHSEFSGISLHEMTPEFDAGPILLKEPIPLDKGDGFDELALKMFAAAPRLLMRVLNDLDTYFGLSEHQGLASYWPAHTDAERTVVLREASIKEVKAIHQKFGVIGTILEFIDGKRVQVVRLSASVCKHEYTPGDIVARNTIGWLVAVRDGLLRLDDPQPIKA